VVEVAGEKISDRSTQAAARAERKTNMMKRTKTEVRARRFDEKKSDQGNDPQVCFGWYADQLLCHDMLKYENDPEGLKKRKA
jgi:hypothetical protein